MAYALATHYAGQALLDGFSFFTGKDPSNGFVNYQSQPAALSQGLVSIDEFNRVRLGVDTYNNYTVSDVGRPSVRLTSYQGFTHGLFIADFAHMPASTCGVWPAFWAFNNDQNGAKWPLGGELDILEGANTASRNLLSAHTLPGCQLPSTGFTGQQGPNNCEPGPGNVGCNYASPTSDATSYGDSFNAEGGGTYALEWDSDGLKIWHFPRSAIPSDIAFAPLTSPDPASWGPPQAIFGGLGCDTDSFFFNMSLVINVNLCGDYAGNVWGVTDKCNTLAPTCKEYVASYPEAFLGAFWDVNYIDVYQKPDSPKPSTSSSATVSTASPNATSIATSLPSVDTTALPSPGSTRTITLTTATPSSVPTKSGGGLSDPSMINGYTLLGCFGSSSGYPTWSSAADFATMDNEACVASCAGRKYSGVFATTCYCADNLGDASAVENAQCERACPGNPNESCGGLVKGTNNRPSIPPSNTTTANNTSLPLSRRAAPANILLTVYGNIAAAPPPAGAPAMGGSSSATAPAPVVAVTGSNGGDVSGGSRNITITSVVTMTYTTVCATNPAQLVAADSAKSSVPTAAAVAAVGKVGGGMGASWNGTWNGSWNGTSNGTAQAAAKAVVPMTTYTETCSACGPRGANTVTLTIPMAVATAAGPDVVVTEIAVATVIPVILSNSNSSRLSSNGTNGTAAGVSRVNQFPVMAGASSTFGDNSVGVTGMTLCLALLGAVFLL
ncbi:WSC domain [Apiospora marii]|uniref:WSC domain n=1 Tax=Apiospora marii TaxID=335849 RepID=A0ABR1SA59_9PEZI